jgi:hypothetical protein
MTKELSLYNWSRVRDMNTGLLDHKTAVFCRECLAALADKLGVLVSC